MHGNGNQIPNGYLVLTAFTKCSCPHGTRLIRGNKKRAAGNWIYAALPHVLFFYYIFFARFFQRHFFTKISTALSGRTLKQSVLPQHRLIIASIKEIVIYLLFSFCIQIGAIHGNRAAEHSSLCRHADAIALRGIQQRHS